MDLKQKTTLDDSWVEAFQFSKELSPAEKAVIEDYRAEPKKETSPSGSQDKQFLDQLSETIAKRLGNKLADPEILDRYFRIQQMECDTRLMANHIETLMEKIEHLETENAQLRYQQSQYKSLFGKFFIKL
jgi:hypothetical protein